MAKAELERMRTELKQAYADRAQAHAAKFQVCEAADAVLSNEEHALSGGMRSYKKGSPTWEAYDNLRRATQSAYQTAPRATVQSTEAKLPQDFTNLPSKVLSPGAKHGI